MLWTIKETARQLAISVRTVERLIEDGELTPIRIRKSRRLDEDAVRAWVKQISPGNPIPEYNGTARARMHTEVEPCARERKTETASTNNRGRQTGTAVIPMRPGSGAAEVRERIAARKQKRS